MKLQFPSFEKGLAKLRSFRWQAKPKPTSRERMPVRRQASTRRATVAANYDEMNEEPTTRLSSAFIIVLILHIVAVAGIYAFNSIKAHRTAREPIVATEKVEKPAPARAEKPDGGIVSTTKPAPAAHAPTQKTYTAHGGESLAKVASLNGVSLIDLASLNGLRESSVLKPNQLLVIPQVKNVKPTANPKPAVVANANDAKKAEFLQTRAEDQALLQNSSPKPKPKTTTPKSYTIVKGDTLTSIARKNSVTVDELMKANKIDDTKKLQIGKDLLIPAK